MLVAAVAVVNRSGSWAQKSVPRDRDGTASDCPRGQREWLSQGHGRDSNSPRRYYKSVARCWFAVRFIHIFLDLPPHSSTRQMSDESPLLSLTSTKRKTKRKCASTPSSRDDSAERNRTSASHSGYDSTASREQIDNSSVGMEYGVQNVLKCKNEDAIPQVVTRCDSDDKAKCDSKAANNNNGNDNEEVIVTFDEEECKVMEDGNDINTLFEDWEIRYLLRYHTR
ncbi:hypothetical protein MRB53_038454 [Persea americana]|nr:hypothetical protein MRB53_038454 [Persea americana]